MKTSFHLSIKELDDEFLEIINPGNSVYFSRPLLHGFEASNAQVQMRYVCISDEGAPQALALVQIIELSVDVILKNIKASRLKIKNNTPSVKLNPKDNTKLQFTSSYDIYLDTNA